MAPPENPLQVSIDPVSLGIQKASVLRQPHHYTTQSETQLPMNLVSDFCSAPCVTSKVLTLEYKTFRVKDSESQTSESRTNCSWTNCILAGTKLTNVHPLRVKK